MPTYDYVCDACGHAFEEFQSIMAKPIRKCPKCAKLKVRRLIGTGAGIIFKGSGFYCTDYRDKTYHSAAQKDKSASAGGESAKSGESSGKADAASDKSQTKAESKPASKPAKTAKA